MTTDTGPIETRCARCSGSRFAYDGLHDCPECDGAGVTRTCRGCGEPVDSHHRARTEHGADGVLDTSRSCGVCGVEEGGRLSDATDGTRGWRSRCLPCPRCDDLLGLSLDTPPVPHLWVITCTECADVDGAVNTYTTAPAPRGEAIAAVISAWNDPDGVRSLHEGKEVA